MSNTWNNVSSHRNELLSDSNIEDDVHIESMEMVLVEVQNENNSNFRNDKISIPQVIFFFLYAAFYIWYNQ